MESQVNKIYGKAYKEWLEKNYPDNYEAKYGKKKPVSKLKKVVRGSALAAATYELAKEVLKIEDAGVGSTMIPYDTKSREMHRQEVINANIPKVSYDDKGKLVLTPGNDINLKEYLPYKKVINSDIPKVPGQSENVEGVDYVWVDPLDDQFGSVEHYDDSDKYQLTEFGYVNKSDLQDPLYTKIPSAYKTLKSFVPPETRKQIKEVSDALVYSATGGRYPK
tara:strand:- start:5830 stop:6492 length:663 start_codon:yes stop_codon:yes gene_type:complete